MVYDFLSMYNSYKGNETINDISCIARRTLLPGFFYSIIQRKNTDKPYNMNLLCLAIGESKVDNGKYIIIDLCMLPIKVRLKFVELFYKSYNTQIVNNMSLAYDAKDANLQKPINSFTLKNVQQLLRIMKIGNAIIKVSPEDFKNVRLIPFSQVYKLINLCDTNNFTNISIQNAQNIIVRK